jgi:hypothetical protein
VIQVLRTGTGRSRLLCGVQHARSDTILSEQTPFELTDAELGAISGGYVCDGLDPLRTAMGGSKVLDNLIRKFDIYYDR